MDFIVHFGDLAYNLASNDGEVGNRFMDNVEPISSKLPYVTLPGNHEYADGDKNEDIYRGFFIGQTKLGRSSQSTDPIMWHSYDIGTKLHMIGINTEVYCEATNLVEAQWKWLAADLAKVHARAVKPWIIVYGHRQIYHGSLDSFHSRLMRSGMQCEDASLTKCNVTEVCKSGKNCAYSLEKLFNDYQVDMFFAGHMHSYVRMMPIGLTFQYEEQSSETTFYNPQHPTYIVSGAPGTQHDTTEELDRIAAAGPSVFYSTSYSFSNVKVYNTTHLQLQQIAVSDSAVMDEMWIIKESSKPIAKLTNFTLSANDQDKCDQ